MRHTGYRSDALSIRVPASLSARLARVARKRRVPVSVVIREALELVGEATASSFTELAGDLCGRVAGPPDLSTNPKYLNGYGK